MIHVACTIAYDGSRFEGFAPQPSPFVTVVGEIEKALCAVGVTQKVLGAGRTDKGVHATGQVIGFPLPLFWKDRLDNLKERLNRYLFPSILIKSITPVSETFHPRFSAQSRTYRYLLTDKSLTPFQAPYITYVPYLNREKIIASTPLFQGDHDFEFFKKHDEIIGTSRRTMFKSFAYPHKELLVCTFEAQGFLRSQIRLMVDFLLKISRDELTQEDLIEQRDRKEIHSRTLAPPHGLYLTSIRYGTPQ